MSSIVTHRLFSEFVNGCVWVSYREFSKRDTVCLFTFHSLTTTEWWHNYWPGLLLFSRYCDGKSLKGSLRIISNSVPFLPWIAGLEFSASHGILYSLTRIPTILLDKLASWTEKAESITQMYPCPSYSIMLRQLVAFIIARFVRQN